MKVVIVGGGAGGASCAARLRRLNEKAEIVVLEKSAEHSVATCGLPYYVGNVITDEKNMHVASAKMFQELFNIDLKLSTEVVEINTYDKFVRTQTNEVFYYDKLVLAMGNSSVIPDIEGVNLMPHFTLKHLEDAEKIKNFIQNNNVSSVVVVGGGFVGIETAENFHRLGIKVSLIEASDQVLQPLDSDMIMQIHQELRRHGISVMTNDKIQAVTSRQIRLFSGRTLDTQLIIFAAGVKPETEIVRGTDISTESKGFIRVNHYMQTNIKDIYACGDCAAVRNLESGEYEVVPLAGPANRQGRLIADHIMGQGYAFQGSFGAGIIQVFDLTAAFVGKNEKQLKKAHESYHKMITWDKSNAGYYPSALPLTLKVLYNDAGKILGAQAVGQKNVDKQIDVIAAIMHMRGSVEDLRDVEHCYAPPFSSAKSPINMIGMAIQNVRQGLVKPFFGNDFTDMLVLDVRPKRMYDLEHIAGAVNIPALEIRSRMAEIPRDKNILIHCMKGYTSYVVCRILMQHGYTNVFSYAGGWQQYKAEAI